MTATSEAITTDLKAQFGGKVWISPKEFETLTDISVSQQAKLRCQKKFPFTVRHFGRSVKISIYEIADALATEIPSDRKEDLNKVSSTTKKETPPQPKRSNKTKKKSYAHLLPQWQSQIAFQYELIVEIETTARTYPDTEKPHFTPEDLKEWRDRLYSEQEQIAQIEKQILLSDMEGQDYPDLPDIRI